MSNWLVNKLGQLEREAGAVMVSQSQNDQVLVAELRTWYTVLKEQRRPFLSRRKDVAAVD